MARVLTLSRRFARYSNVELASTSMTYWSSGFCFALAPEPVLSSSWSPLGAARSCRRIASPNSGFEVTITTCCGPWPMVANFAGSAIKTVTMAGASNVSTRNERVRTRCKYSRWMINQVLRIWFTHRFDEDLLQGGLHYFELGQPCVCGRQAQQVLRVRTRSETHLNIVAIVVV